MRPLGHLTPRYIANRLALAAFERRNPDLPWLTADMIAILDSWLLRSDVGLEFGSGRSTKWFASRVSHLTSVEDNREWYERVKPQVSHLQVNYYLFEDGSTKSDASDYVAVVNGMEDDSLDFCLVDGSARDHCALASLKKLKSGGILIIDNVNWYIPRQPKKSFSPNGRTIQDGYASSVWEIVGKEISSWRNIWTTNGVTDTAFWVKP
jgi:hypothetical protein